MGRLREGERQATLGFLRSLYALQDHEGYVNAVVHGLQLLIPADLTAYCEIDPVRGTSKNWLDRPEVDTPEAQLIWQTHMLEHPAVAHFVSTRDGRARRTTDFMTQRQFRQTGVYVEHYRPKDLAYGLTTWIGNGSRPALVVGVDRGKRDFTDGERLTLELLRPHLTQAWRNAQLVSKLKPSSRLGRALASLHPEVVVLTDRGKVLFVGDHARRLLADHFGRSSDGVPDDVLTWVRSVSARLHLDASDVPAPPSPLVHDLAGRRLTLRAFTRGHEIVVAVDERSRAAEVVLLGLTAREREVLAWVREGKTNEDIAVILRCAPKTVEKHLEHIYSKLDVSNRAAAAALETAASLAGAR